MILETQQERDAFEFVLSLADKYTFRRGCNDLTEKEKEKFQGLTIQVSDVLGNTYKTDLWLDSHVIQWLADQVKKE